MFAAPQAPPGLPARRREVPPAVATRIRPLSATRDQLLAVLEPLAPLLPDGGLRRGTTVVVAGEAGRGATTLALGLMAAASAAGSWCAVVGLADLGVAALGELGVDLAQVALVPEPGSRWADTVAALVDGLDVVVVRPPGPVGKTATRHLAARTRDRRSVLVVLGRQPRVWAEVPEVTLEVEASSWWGVERGHLPLQARLVEVRSAARRSARCARRQLWLPDRHGAVAVAPPGLAG